MRKLILMCAIVVLVAGGSAQAQKPIKLIGPPIQFDQAINLEDDATGSFLVFNTGSGKYKFTRCIDGLTISGVGSVKVDGCSIFLEDVQAGHRVVASINECDQQGKALVEKFAPADTIGSDGAPFKVFLNDANMGNNLMDCAPKK
jgi:hypothetical protein